MKIQSKACLMMTMLAVVHTCGALGTADLRLTASFPPAAYYSSGVDLVYTILITNSGPASATGVIVSNRLPANVTFISTTGGSSPTNGLLLLNLGTLAAGATNLIQIIVQPALAFPAQSLGQPTSQFTNVFRVYANETDPNPSDNSTSLGTTVADGFPGTPLAWNNPGGQFVITESILFSGAPRPIHVGAPYGATNGQPGDIVLLIDPNGGTNISNWAAVARFFNPADPTGTNSLPATNSQAFFASDFGSSGFTNFRLLPVVAYIPMGTATTNSGIVTIATQYTEFGSIDGIFAGQLNFDQLNINVALAISLTNNKAIVSWSPAVSGWTLQTNKNLAAGIWGDYSGSIGNNSVTNSSPTGNLFFRLTHL